MATLTSLGFNIFSRWDGSGTRRATRDINQLRRNLNSASRGINTFSGRLGATAIAAGTLGPALLPIANVVGNMGASFIAAGAAAVTAGGLWAAGAAVQIGATKKAVAEQLKGIKPTKAFAKAQDEVVKSFVKFANATKAPAAAPLIPVYHGISVALGKLPPLYKAVSREVQVLGVATGKWLSGSGFERFIKMIREFGVPALRMFIRIGRDVAATIGIAWRTLLPTGNTVIAMLMRGAAAMRSWAEGGGFKRWLESVHKQSPAVKEFFRALWGALKNVGKVLAQSAPAALRLATNMAKLVASTPPQTIRAIANAWLLMKSPFTWLIVNVPALQAMFIKIMTTLKPRDVYALAAAWIALRVAMEVGGSWGGLIAALAVVGLGIYFLATRTRFFQTVWSKMVDIVRSKWSILIAALGPLAWLIIMAANWRKIINFMGAVAGGTFRYIGDRFSSLGRWFSKLYSSIFRGVIQALGGGLNWLGKTASKALAFMGDRFRSLGRFFGHIYTGIIRPVIRALGGGLNFLGGVARKALSYIGDRFSSLARFIRHMWNVVTHPVFRAFSAAMNWVAKVGRAAFAFLGDRWSSMTRFLRQMWNAVGHPVLRAFAAAARWLGGAARGAFKFIGDRWRSMGRFIHDVWSGTINSAFKAVRKGVDTVKKAFDVAIKGIGKIWNKLKGITKGPVKFFVNTVYNKGLRNAWNKTAGKIPGVPDLPHAPLPFKSGGEIPGSGSGGDRVPIIGQAGEYIIKRDRVRQLGTRYLDWLNGGHGKAERGHHRHHHHRHNKRWRDYHFGHESMSKKWRRPGHFFLGGLLPDPGDLFKKVAGIAAGGLDFLTGGPLGFDFAQGIMKSVAKKAMQALFSPFRGMLHALTNHEKKKSGVVPVAIEKNANRGFDKMIDFVFSKAMDDAGNGFIPWADWKNGDGTHVSFRGVTVNRRTRAMLLHAEKLAKRAFNYYQGSYSNGSKSAGTHSGGGAVDLGPASNENVGRLRASGFAAWARSPSEGFSPHIHGIAVGDPTASPAAKQQVADFFKGLNGLANKGPDTYVPPGGGGSGVGRWRALALVAMRMGGLSTSQIGKFLSLMAAESGGNPKAHNASGASGLMQVMPGTFKAYHVKGTSMNIYDPLANMAASANYIKHVYHGNVPGSPYASGGLVTHKMKRGVYDTGGYLPTGWSMAYNGTGKPEPVGHDLDDSHRWHHHRHHKWNHKKESHHKKGECAHIHFHDKVYAKSEREFEDMLTRCVRNLQRKNRVKVVK